MTHTSASPRRFRSAVAAAALFAATMFPALAGSQVVRRLYSLPSSSDPRVSLPDTLSPRVRSASVLGHLGGETQLTGMSLVLKPTDAQAAALQQLLADQQNPSSPQYHKWLTPQTFGEQFGLSDADLSIVKDWLTSKGFTVDEVAPSRNRIVFSGTASAVESAFTTSLQRFHRADQDYFENSTAISLPQSLAGVVSGITGISSFHIQPPVHTPQALAPQYTNSAGAHYIVPWDFRQIFGINTLISQGFDGTGIKIGVIGQSSVDATQLSYFQGKTSDRSTQPTYVLVPNTGSSGQLSKSDEGESELDLEYATGSAPGAQVLFIYTGTSTATTNNGVFTALIYAVTNNLAPILTLSYGGCEATNASYANSVLEPILTQASSQGQTILVSSGDEGAASCESNTNTTTTAANGLSVSYPASSPNVTAVGGTQLNSDDSAYWTSSNNSYGGSAIGYMPETSWNDTVAYKALSASGGGFSTVFPKPTWQTGTGVPSDGHRDVPDVAFPAAVEEHAYIVCTVSAPCTAVAGFGTGGGGGGLIGGTSASAPNFAAMLAVVEQANGGGALGNINSQLYSLASGSGASSIFHDITTGNNIVNCTGGTTGCSSTAVNTTGTMGYNAGTGYDMVTGLGSLDANGLATGLKSSTSTGAKLTPKVSLFGTSLSSSMSQTITVSVTGTGSTPTGTVALSIDGTLATTFTLVSGGTYTYTYTVPTCTTIVAPTCVHYVSALYSGDTTYYSGSATFNVTVPTTGTLTSGSISLAPASSTLTVTAGNTGTDVITVSSNGFAGAVTFKMASSVAISNACYTLPGGNITSGSQATTTLTISTSSASCSTASSSALRGGPIANTSHPELPWRGGIAVFAAGLVGVFFLRRRIRPTALLLVLFSAALLGVSGCGGSGSGTTSSGGSSGGTTSSTYTAKGTYPLTITATGVPTNGAASITATTTVTLVVQ
jgi:subtilase family serine protease